MRETDTYIYLTCRWQTSGLLGRAVLHGLRVRGFSTYFDADSERFTAQHAAQIDARPHMLALLSPFTLDHFTFGEMRLRAEIGYASERLRAITLAACYGASLGNVTLLRHFRSARLDVNALDATLDRLVSKHLSKESFAVLKPPPTPDPDLPPPPGAHELAAEAALNRGLSRTRADYDHKLADYTEAIRLHSTYAQAYFNRAVVRGRMTDYAGAFDDYTAAITHNPKQYRALTNRAELLYVAGAFADALRDYEQALALDPADDRMQRAGKALTLLALDRADEARALWQSLVDEDVRFRDAEWVGRELHLPAPMIDDAHRLLLEIAP